MKKTFLSLALFFPTLLSGCISPYAINWKLADELDWVTSSPVDGDDYRLVLYRVGADINAGCWYLKDETRDEVQQGGKEYYITSTQTLEDSATVKIRNVEGGFTIQVGKRYLVVKWAETTIDGETYSAPANYLKTNESEASIFTWSEDITTFVSVLEDRRAEYIVSCGTMKSGVYTDSVAYLANHKDEVYKVLLAKHK